MEFIKINDLDPRHITIGPTTPSGIQTITDYEHRCPRCASVDVTQTEVYYPLAKPRFSPADWWSECNNCGWHDKIDPQARLYADGSICTDWPF